MMKQQIAVVMAVMVAMTVITGAALAEEHGQGMQHGKMMQGEKEMSEKKEMMKDMRMMHRRMTGGMTKRQVVATSDGGVVIIVGNLVIKYDKDLELVKKTTIEISDEDLELVKKTIVDIDEEETQLILDEMKRQAEISRKMMSQTNWD